MHMFKIEASLRRLRKYDYDVVDLTSVVQQRYLSTQQKGNKAFKFFYIKQPRR